VGGLRFPEIFIIMAVLLLFFGATRLPQLGSSLGSAIRNFKRGFGGEDDEADKKKTGDSLPPGSDRAEQVVASKTKDTL
jgi:TatA/E family protein of Tat protein translocase